MAGYMTGEPVWVHLDGGDIQEGTVVSQRMCPPDYTKPLAVTVNLRNGNTAVCPADRVSVTKPPDA